MARMTATSGRARKLAHARDASTSERRRDEREALIDVDAAPASCFGLADERGAHDTGWHGHNRHQLLYAVSGSLHLQVEHAQWLLPPQRAAFIPAGLTHRVRCLTRVALRTVYLALQAPANAHAGDVAIGLIDHECCVLSVTPLAREMILHAMRWGPRWTEEAPAHEAAIARSYFATLALLASEWIRADAALRLPRPRSPDLARACDYVLANLAGASMDQAARVAGVSERTLARRFQRETQMSWRAFLRTARILRAMELLAQPGTNVTETALAVGFENLGAFSKSFRETTGETPTAYQRRVT